MRSAKSTPAAESRKRAKGVGENKSGYYIYLIPGLVTFVIVIGGSFFYNTYISFTKWNGLGKPRWVGLQNYEKLMQDSTFWQSFLHAFYFIAAMSIIPTFLGVFLAALLFDYIAPRFGNKSAAFMRAGLYMPQIVPLTITGIMWAWLLAPTTGVVNSFLTEVGLERYAANWLGDAKTAILSLSVIMVWVQIGYTIVIFMSGMSRLDPSLHEAAQIDGASWFQRFRVITWAQLGPEISVVLLTTTVAALKVFAPVYVMTGGGPGTATQVPAFFSYFHFFTTTKVGYGAAVATVLAVLLTILAVIILNVQNRQQEGANPR
jgi:raffinose/stachyose/melibiose transport system permease protein